MSMEVIDHLPHRPLEDLQGLVAELALRGIDPEDIRAEHDDQTRRLQEDGVGAVLANPMSEEFTEKHPDIAERFRGNKAVYKNYRTLFGQDEIIKSLHEYARERGDNVKRDPRWEEARQSRRTWVALAAYLSTSN